MLSVRISVKLLATVVAIFCVASVRADGISRNAEKIIERTKSTKATYAVFFRNRISQPGRPVIEEASAEFHHGSQHRVETPRDRIVANCSTNLGIYFSVASGEMVESPNVAAAACGIDSNQKIISMKLVGKIVTKFGTAQGIRIVGKDNIREYDVSTDGILLRTTYTENRSGGSLLIVTEAVRVERKLPDENMFSKASLEKSFLVEQAQ